ncbi:MAG TPA: histidine kinase, partial [Vicinamibacterales bacterium]|nr:histidine kinase [Vicinamibacterales bacterium]
MRFRLSTWLWIWAAWTLVGIFFGTTLWLNYVAAGRESSFRASLTVSLAEWWIWALLTPIPVLLARRWPLWPPWTARALLVHVPAGLGVAFLKAILERFARIWLFGVAPYLLPNNIVRHFLMYTALVGATHAVGYYQRSRERELEASRIEAQLHRARLDALEDQLRPHFLFNALNTIAEVVHEDPDKADRMIASLGDLLRGTLEREGPTIPLA